MDTSINAIQPLLHQLTLSHWVAMENMKDISHEESLSAPRDGGNCMNWVVGHIVSARSGLIEVLGGEPVFNGAEAQLYRRGSGPLEDSVAAVSFEKLVRTFDATQEAILSGIANLEIARLAEKAPFSPTNNAEETIGSLIAGLVFHDAYHIGQTGILRATLGKAGVA